MNMHGSGEISTWDLTDESGSITLVAFNLNSHLLSNKLKKDKMYEFVNLSIRPASDLYKTLPHQFELLCNTGTRVEEIISPLINQELYHNFVHLNQVDNYVSDIQVRVMRDSEISTGQHNDKLWFRRDLHIIQDETQIRMTLWNSQIITHRISDLMQLIKDQNVKNTHICISIQNDNDTREFCYLTIDELTQLFQQTPVIERCLYEVIFPTNQVKTYIDFEYYITNNLDIESPYIGARCFLKILYNLLNFQQNIDCEANYKMDLILQQFLVLNSCTSDKISYHFIHANPCVLFENNLTLGLFVRIAINFLLYSIAQHKCSSFSVNFDLQKNTTIDLLLLLTPYINILRKCCTNCKLYGGYVTVSEIAHLLVLNKQNEFTTAVDVNVYSQHQQFRLFDCVKRGKMNPLVRSSNFQFHDYVESSYYEILQKSLITYIHQLNLPIISIKNNQFQWTTMNEINLLETTHKSLLNLNHINRYFNIFYGLNTKSISDQRPCNLTIESTTYSNINHDTQVELFRPFVENLIKQDRSHQGYIRSCVRGTYNADMLFFNIGGQYRYCDLLKNYKTLNDTDEAGLLLSLFTCVGHFAGDSLVRITNHVSNLNIFLLLIGPSDNLN
ncbi:unnamed protein product [Rotaria sordida]|uniref:DNA-directed primase/polymerase protein n=1 Tax=Rotaria sordida TaxID=392033 RepID=A0A815X6H1_9BILA|nr:unnamed protein product [Rotaria sordida]CAF1551094.1 unnamed protein product [Rotaria sordida]